MGKINYQNLPSTTTPLNATNMNAMQTDIARSDTVQMYSAGLEIVVSTAWTAFKLPLDRADVTGTALSFDSTNKRIVANQGGYVDLYVQLNVFADTYLNGDYDLMVYKNGAIFNSLDYQDVNGTKRYEKLSGQQFNVPCVQGDYFELYLSCGGTGTVKTFAGARTSLTVKFNRES